MKEHQRKPVNDGNRRYEVPCVWNGGGRPQYRLTPEQESEFRRLYPVTTNWRMMELFGLSHGVVYRLAAGMGLKKDRADDGYRRAFYETRRAVMESEKRRVRMGLSQHTRLHIAADPYTISQYQHRRNARRRGYVCGQPDEGGGERFTIYYTPETRRTPVFERNLMRDRFTVLPIGSRCAR